MDDILLNNDSPGFRISLTSQMLNQDISVKTDESGTVFLLIGSSTYSLTFTNLEPPCPLLNVTNSRLDQIANVVSNAKLTKVTTPKKAAVKKTVQDEFQVRNHSIGTSAKDHARLSEYTKFVGIQRQQVFVYEQIDKAKKMIELKDIDGLKDAFNIQGDPDVFIKELTSKYLDLRNIVKAMREELLIMLNKP